jgi:PleD family two-component response regulator
MLYRRKKKINSIKKEFSELDQSSITDNFTITFSAGIATITSVTLNVNSEIEAANAALSEAKSAGYNLVKVAP